MVSTPKTKRGERVVYIDAETVGMLRRQQETQNARANSVGARVERLGADVHPRGRQCAATRVRHPALPSAGPGRGAARYPAPRLCRRLRYADVSGNVLFTGGGCLEVVGIIRSPPRTRSVSPVADSGPASRRGG